MIDKAPEAGGGDDVVALRRELARQKSLVEASQTLHSTLNQDELLKIILTLASKAIDVERGTVYLMSADGAEIWSRVTAGKENLVIRLPLGRGIAGAVAKTGETIRIDDAYKDPRFDPSTDKRSGFHTRSILCAPIKNRKDQVVGVFQLLNRRGGPFEQGDVEYLDALSVHAALAIENAMLHKSALEKERQDREIQVAQGIQRALLPADASLEAPPYTLFGINELCEDASGDYYDFFPLDDGRVLVAVGDVSGHGLGSALVMAEARALLRAFAKTVPELDAVVTLLNDFLCRDMTQGKFMTMFVGVLDPKALRLSWCSAGHNPPVVWRAATGDVIGLDPTGPVLGVIGGIPYARGEDVALEKGDVVLVYTDGATEAPAPTGQLFGDEQLQEVVKKSAAGGPAAVLDAVRQAIRTWTGGAKNRDDLTLVAIRVGTAAPAEVPAESGDSAGDAKPGA
jgi:serine phosphatase RsbU (regulator of sigma subunit)